MIGWGVTTERILDLLVIPMTVDDLCAELDLHRNRVSAVVTRLSRAGAKTPRRVHIADWVFDGAGRRYPRAVYALGDKRDKPKPAVDVNAIHRRYYAKRKGLTVQNNVFALGTPVAVWFRGAAE